jgi:hypothetical protein
LGILKLVGLTGFAGFELILELVGLFIISRKNTKSFFKEIPLPQF